MEFLQKKSDGLDYVIEVIQISNDGIKVTQSHPNGRQGVLLSDSPPDICLSTAVSYAFSALPTKLWKKYQYAEKFVRLVKMKTPKVCYFFIQSCYAFSSFFILSIVLFLSFAFLFCFCQISIFNVITGSQGISKHVPHCRVF